VQQAIVVLMDNTLKELRGTAPSLDSAELTVESCIFHSFDRSVLSVLFFVCCCVLIKGPGSEPQARGVVYRKG